MSTLGELDFSLIEATYDPLSPGAWRRAPHIRVWDRFLAETDDYRFEGTVSETATAAALKELNAIRPELLNDGVIDLGSGVYPGESYKLLAGGYSRMRYTGVDDLARVPDPSKLFRKLPFPADSIWPKNAGLRPVNAVMIRADMVEFLHDFFEKSKGRAHFFINGQDDFVHWDKSRSTVADTVSQLARAQEGSLVFGFSLQGGILHELRSQTAFETVAHITAGKSDDGFLFFRKR